MDPDTGGRNSKPMTSHEVDEEDVQPNGQQAESSLIEASYADQYSTVFYLVNSLPPSSLDETGTVKKVGSSQGDLHNCTALNIACIQGYADITKLLLEAGASHSIRDCTGSTPFSEAVYHNRIQLVQLLHQFGADIDTVNSFGWTPLHVAAFQGNLEMVVKLLELGVDVTRVTSEGYTAMHMAAMSGRRAVITYLLEEGVSPCFDEVTPETRGSYRPCPLFLAVVGHFKGVANKFLQRPDCPLTCRVDAMMLTGAVDVFDSRIRQAQSKWSNALKLRADLNIPLHPASPSDDYGDRCEIANLTELGELFQGDSVEIEAAYQSVIIWERCVGAMDQRYWQHLTHLIEKLVDAERFNEAERIILRGFKRIESSQLPLLEKGCLLPQNFEVFCGDTLKIMVFPYLTNPVIVSFEATLFHAFAALDVLISRGATIYATFGCPNFVPKFLSSIILQIFDMWLTIYPITPSQSESRDTIGRNFVSKYLTFADGCNLLFIALQTQCQDKPRLIEALLQWGAREAINSVYNGQRLFQVLLNVSSEMNTCREQGSATIVDSSLLNVLVKYGIHGDAVDRSGRSAIDCCPQLFDPATSSPPPLACLIAQKIAKEGLPYQDMTNVAPRLKKFIMMHDVKAHLV